jgi:DNA-binding MarR family transcriptional regulator
MTQAAIANALASTPSATSYHLAFLQRAGLVARERWGRHVLVERTPTGVELLKLFGEA